MAHADARMEILEAFGATPATAAEILASEANGYERVTLPSDVCFPLDDEPFVPAWQSYGVEAAARGFTALTDRLVQLHFPIRLGISLTEEYRAATRRGQQARELPEPSKKDGGGGAVRGLNRITRQQKRSWATDRCISGRT